MKDKKKLIQMNEAKWDQWADSLDGDSRRSVTLREAQRQVISRLELYPGIHFLDVGCGTGWAVGQVAGLVKDQGLFYGVDLSARMVDKAKRNFHDRPSLRFLQASSDSIPLEGDYFQAIICTNSFHHYPYPDRALKEMNRLLAPGGKLLILDPTADHWFMKVADQFIKRIEPEHIKMYSTREFQQHFQEAGLIYRGSDAINLHQTIHIGEK